MRTFGVEADEKKPSSNESKPGLGRVSLERSGDRHACGESDRTFTLPLASTSMVQVRDRILE